MRRRRHSFVAVLLITIAASTASAQDLPEFPGEDELQRSTASLSEPRPNAVVGALADSLRLLTIEHLTRIALQPKTRNELGGPFLKDYRRSVRVPRTWSDGDGWLVNYVGHPIHGAAAGHLWLDHAVPRRGIDGRGDSWRGRAAAFGWATAYSLQFEFGPYSEASIGNVGLRPNTTGWVDHVVTPAGAVGVLWLEDVADRTIVAALERRTGKAPLRAIYRMAFNPARTLANVAQGRWPWERSGRPLRRLEVKGGRTTVAGEAAAGTGAP